jgi:4-diphosphocytidyl-2-C-methyl-D-erythritol kinase
VSRRPARVTVEARAKLNLGLAVGPRRADGYHDLVTVFQSISLADTLVAERTTRGFSLRVRHEDAAIPGRRSPARRDVVPTGPDNLVLRAARLVHEELGLPGGARFTLVKRIPAQAGMGGGSADAAAALAAVLRLHSRRVTRARILAWSLRLGSDVPFASLGGTALGEGRGERLTRMRLSSSFRAIVAMPAWRVSTKDAFRRHHLKRFGLTPWEEHRRFARTVGRTRASAESLARRGNRFEQLLGHHRRDLESLRARMRAAGLPDPYLTGSGSAVFAIVPRGASVRGIVARFIGNEPLFEVRSVGRGLRFL